jgi:hypothetical protein
MNPCAENRKLIAWLAVNALEVREEQCLRAHLETCEGCRGYLAEISNVTEKLSAAAITSDIRASEAFHQKLTRRLRAETPASVWETLAAQIRGTGLNWRVAVPALGALAVMLVALFVSVRPSGISVPPTPQIQAVLTPVGNHEIAPTLYNYQSVANRSLQNLDELLNRQANRNPSRTPIYTAAVLSHTPDVLGE